MLRKNKIAVVSENRYYWIPQLVLHKDNNYKVFDGISFSKSEKDENVLLISDDQVQSFLHPAKEDKDKVRRMTKLQTIYDSTFPLAVFEENKYPSIVGEWNSPKIEIRTNRTDDMLLNSSAFTVKIRNGTIIKDGSKLEIVVPANPSGILPSDWDDSVGNCGIIFHCTPNFTTGWKDNTSFQLSTDTTKKNTWSYISGKEINVNPGEKYQLVTHMKLNQFATQSHIVIEGHNQTSKKWNQIVQCPSGTNGPLQWHEFRCTITIPASTGKIRPILNAGWSSQGGKQAVTYFDGVYLKLKGLNNRFYPYELPKLVNTNITTSNSSVISNPDFVDFNSGRIASLCQLRGDFDVQADYRFLNESPSHWSRLSLIAQKYSNDNMTHDKTINDMDQIMLESKMKFPSQRLGTYLDGDTHLLNANTTYNTSGKLRIIRSGFTVTGYYYSFGKWVPIYFGHLNPMDVNIILQTATDFGSAWQPVKIVFDDHIINKGHIVNCQ